MEPELEASVGGSANASTACSASTGGSARAIFVFPAAAGHVNPSLPLARGLVARGWVVDYLAIAQFREAIEDTGATFHDRDGVCRERGTENVTEMVLATAKEYSEPPPQWWLNFGSISTARLLPIYTDWFRSRRAQLVVYCPVLCQVARFAAAQLRIPAVSLLTTAGPGYFDAAIAGVAGAAAVRAVAAGLVAEVGANEANARAIESLRSQLPVLPELTLNSTEPLSSDYYAAVNLVSTTEELADPMCAADTEYYRAAGKSFSFVGPLLDEAGAKRSQPGQTDQEQQQELLRRVEAAVVGGRQIVYVSMGTVITSDHAEHGWGGSSGSGISGRQLCQSVYRAVFDELGETGDDAEGGQNAPPLIVVSLGPRPDALTGVPVPSNAVCMAAVAQVELLRMGKPALFVTNGGQNSLMESMTVGTPVLVCPGFGDQVSNAAKVESQGWGAKVSRPPAPAAADDMPAVADPIAPAPAVAAEEVVAAYQAAVQSGVREVLGRREFAQQAQLIAAGLAKAEGVDGALRILIEASTATSST